MAVARGQASASPSAQPAVRPSGTQRALPSGGSWIPRMLVESPSVLPALVAVGIFLWLAASEGGFLPTTWYPAALLLLALLLVALVSLPLARPLPRGLLVAIALLFGYAAWSYLSITWADQQGFAWDGANLALLYAIAFTLFALWPMRAVAGTVVVGAFALGVAAIGLVELLRATAASDPNGYFEAARLSEPVGYTNANVALWFSAFWPCIALASRREVPPLLRGAFLGSAGLLAGLALMGQSRGWLLASPIVLVTFVVLVPGRGRTIVALLAVALGGLLMAGPVLDVYGTFDPGANLAEPLSEGAEAILVVSAALALVGLLGGLADRRVSVSARSAGRVSAAVVAALVAATVMTLAAFTIVEGSPLTAASDAWGDFKQGGVTPEAGSDRLTDAGSTYRYDFWRVGWDSFERHPLHGVGADNFQQDYLVRGRSGQQPRFPHSVEVRVLSQTGLVGALLLGGALVAAFTFVARSARAGRSELGAAVGGAAATVFAYWLVHGSIDWFWEFPGLSAPAFAMLGLAVALSRGRASSAGDRGAPTGESTPGPGLRLGRAAAAACAAIACALAVGLGAPWLAEREVSRATSGWRADPDAAFEALDRAGWLNPLSSRPALTAGSIALRLGRFDRAVEEFRAARERDPRDSYALLELGAIASERGDRARAVELLERARRLNPRDRVTVRAAREVRRGARLDVDLLNERISRARRARIGSE